MITQDLGIATAYGYAKSKGYTGTEAEFAELMASYASTAQTAIEAADRAVEANTAAQSAKTDAQASKTAAQTAAQTATTKVSEAVTAANTATTKASEASQSASTASAAATSASTSAQTATANAGTATAKADEAAESEAAALSAKTDAETARDAAAQSASAAAESARTLTIDSTLSQSGQAADAKAVGDALACKVDVRGVGQITPQNIQGVVVTCENILDDAERIYCTQHNASTTDGYITVIGDGTAIIQTESDYCSFLIPVKQNTHYTANNSIRFAVLLKNLNTSGTNPVRYSTVVGSALTNISSFDTGEADHIIVSWNYTSFPIDDFIISEGNTPSADKTITLPDWWTGGSTPTVVEKPKFATVTGNMASGGNLQLTAPRNNLRKGERIVFDGNISSFDSIRIGLTYGTSLAESQQKNFFVIDDTNIKYYPINTATPITVAHGLAIANNIQIIWEMSSEASVKFTLISNGNLFEHEFINFVREAIGNPYVLSVDTVLTNCKLTWTCTDIDKKIWMFGDSYFAYSNVRWTYYLHQYGYDNNCLLDGFPGEGGVNGRVAFNNLLQFGTPKYAVWCLGMNDTTDSESAPATNWVSARNYFLQYCQNNNVIPIFGTIPTVPSINHEQKNEWIRSSGYRYIDFAKAVGANSSGVWFSGMLSSDNVHPTEQGARALFARVLLDFPEIMLDDWG